MANLRQGQSKYKYLVSEIKEVLKEWWDMSNGGNLSEHSLNLIQFSIRICNDSYLFYFNPLNNTGN